MYNLLNSAPGLSRVLRALAPQPVSPGNNQGKSSRHDSICNPRLMRCLCALLLLTAAIHNIFAATESRPNIILILADDLGTETLGCYGGTSYRTPNIDRLAASGIRFTHAFATPLCTNTRVQLMTGKYNNRNWLAFGLLDPKEKTFGHYFQEAGYKTCMTGKWQLWSYDSLATPGAELRRGKGMLPKDAGFDEYSLWHTGHTESKGSRYANPVIDENGTILTNTTEKYGPDIWTDYIADFMTRHQNESFFLYHAMALPHWPMVPTPDSPEWQDPRNRLRQDIRFAKDMIEYTDKVVGRIVTKVEELGLSENTLILFYGDNGTDWRVTSRMGEKIVRGGKSLPTDAGTRVPLIAYWKGVTLQGTILNDLIDSTDFLPTLLDAAHHQRTDDRKIDGHSFFPRLTSAPGNPRDWIYMHQDPRPGWDKDRFSLVRFAQNHRFKLYEDGRLFDIPADELEENPIMFGSDTGLSLSARKLLQKVLDSMKPYPSFNPDVMQRDNPLAKPLENHSFQDQGGYVVIEPEILPMPGDESWHVESSIPGYTGVGYLRSLRDQSKTVQKGAIAFRTKLGSQGKWSIGLRHRKDHSRGELENDFWLRIGQGPWMSCRSSRSLAIGEWGWSVTVDHPDFGEKRLNEVVFDFQRNNDATPYGRNNPTIWIAPRSANVKIDRLVLYQSDRTSRALNLGTPQSEYHPW